MPKAVPFLLSDGIRRVSIDLAFVTSWGFIARILEKVHEISRGALGDDIANAFKDALRITSRRATASFSHD